MASPSTLHKQTQIRTSIGAERVHKVPFVRLKRVENWPSILRREIRHHMNLPFEWGKSDCCFWADIVLAITGWDAIADGRGYDTASGARAMVRQAGYGSMREAVEDRFEEIPIAEAMRGDLVFPDEDLGPMASPFILDGANAFSKSMAGPIVITRAECVRAFAY